MKKRFGVGLILACLLALGLSPGVMATTECDKGAAGPYVRYEPSVDPSLLNAVLNLLGEIPIDFTKGVPFTILFDHTLNLTVDSAIDVAGVDFLVETDVGSITVTLSLPAWAANMSINVANPNCQQIYNECCTYFLCEIPCGIEKAACDGENATLSALLNGNTAGLGFTSATVTQWADVCVNGACKAIHPLEDTTAVVAGFHLQLFPESDPLGIGAFLNDLISSLFSWLTDLEGMLADFFETNDVPPEGVLINAFSSDIKNNGCAPDQAVITCMQSACSVVDQPRHSTAKSVNALFYLLPVGFMVGLILWRRRR